MICCLVVPIGGIIIATTAALFIPHIVDAGDIILSSCSLSISRIVAAAVEVIDCEYYGNMVSGVLRRLVGTMTREVCGWFRHH